MTSSCCIRRSYAAVPYSNLRGAIGTFPIGKSSFAAALYSILRGARPSLYRCRCLRPRTSRTRRIGYAAGPYTFWRDASKISH